MCMSLFHALPGAPPLSLRHSLTSNLIKQCTRAAPCQRDHPTTYRTTLVWDRGNKIFASCLIFVNSSSVLHLMSLIAYS